MAKAVPKTIAIIFRKKNGLAWLIKDKHYNEYNTIHIHAMKLYRLMGNVIETLKGHVQPVSYEELPNRPLTADEKASPTVNLIFVREDGSSLVLDEAAYWQYNEAFFSVKNKLAINWNEFKKNGQLSQVNVG